MASRRLWVWKRFEFGNLVFGVSRSKVKGAKRHCPGTYNADERVDRQSVYRYNYKPRLVSENNTAVLCVAFE